MTDNMIVHSNADSRFRAAAPKAGNLRIPLSVLEHLGHLHGAELKVLLVLGHHQGQGCGRDKKPFPYSIPQIMEDTGLCPRAISQAISRLDKHHLILRVPKHGSLPSRYLVVLEPSAAKTTPKSKKPVRRLRRPAPPPKQAGARQKRSGGRRRKDSDQPRYEQTILI